MSLLTESGAGVHADIALAREGARIVPDALERIGVASNVDAVEDVKADTLKANAYADRYGRVTEWL